MSVIKEFLFALGWKVDNSGLDEAEKKATESARKSSDEWKKAGATITKSIAAVGAAAVGAAAGIFKLAEASAATGDEIAKTSKGLGIAANELQRLRFAAERSGGTAQGMTRALRTMTVGLQDAVTKGTGPVAEGLEAIGLKATELKGLGIEDQFALVAERLQYVGDEAERSGISMKIFGSRGGAALKPLMDEGAAGIRALGDEAERLGLVMRDDALKASEDFTDAILDVKGTLEGLIRDVGISIIPTIQDAIGQVKEWAVANRELIKTKAQDFIRQVMTAIQQLVPPLLQLLPALAQLASIGAELAAALGPGGATAAMIGFKSAMAGSLGPAGLLATALATITSALINVAVEAQNARLAVDDVLQQGRGKRGEGASRFAASAKEGKLQQRRREAAARVRKADAALRNARSRGSFKDQKIAKAAKDAALKRIRTLDKRIAAERKTVAEDEKAANVFTGPSIDDAGSDRVTPKGGRGGGKRSPTEVISAETIEADELFGDELRRLADAGGVGETAVQNALQAAVSSLGSGSSQSVARKAALSRLGSLTGQDLSASGGSDPLLSELLDGENIPDIELSKIARGANPQTLISNITNNITTDVTQNINGAGSPTDVATESARNFRDMFADIVGKASKTVKINYRR
jgi:hypothetical protein